jgi:hypothetical protein
MRRSEVIARAVHKNPRGGLSEAGRRAYNAKGANLKPGVRSYGAASPRDKARWRSWATRFYTNPAGPLKKPNGDPTRLALAARAWGEAAPSTPASAARLAAKGRALLKRYEASKK